MNKYYSNEIWQFENGERVVDIRVGEPLSSNPEKAFIPVFLASEVEILKQKAKKFAEEVAKEYPDAADWKDAIGKLQTMAKELLKII